MPTIQEQKTNILAQLEPAFLYALWFLQEAKKKGDNLGEVKQSTYNARMCGEAICKYLILEKTSQYNKLQETYFNIIEYLYNQCVFDSIATSSDKEKGNNGNLERVSIDFDLEEIKALISNRMKN